jgi:hypothetical protein
MKIKLIIISILIFLTSCIQEEDPIVPIDRGDLEVVILEHSMYDSTSYFNLAQNSFIKSHSMFNWELAFDCSSEHYVRINTGKSVRIGLSYNQSNFDEVTQDDMPDSLLIDNPDGNPIEFAIGRWWDNPERKSQILVMNAGINDRKRPAGSFKFYLELLDDNKLKIVYAKFESEKDSLILEKDISKNYVYASLSNDKVNNQNEPDNTSYDLIFTSRAEYVPLGIIDSSGNKETIQYQVRGVYLNPYNVEAILYQNVDSIPFLDIEYDDVVNLELSILENVIGYNWKDINITSEIYSVDNTMYYIIKSQNGFLYKLRFIRFYSDSGLKGFPEFEIKQL